MEVKDLDRAVELSTSPIRLPRWSCMVAEAAAIRDEERLVMRIQGR